MPNCTYNNNNNIIIIIMIIMIIIIIIIESTDKMSCYRPWLVLKAHSHTDKRHTFIEIQLMHTMRSRLMR
jgi:hypothetical protein